MKLIDADALKKTICYNMPTRAEVNILVDAMPDAIVRCKDCKYYDGDGTCMKNGIAFLTGSWFCADGKRS